jgi:hypothetical protein
MAGALGHDPILERSHDSMRHPRHTRHDLVSTLPWPIQRGLQRGHDDLVQLDNPARGDALNIGLLD